MEVFDSEIVVTWERTVYAINRFNGFIRVVGIVADPEQDLPGEWDPVWDEEFFPPVADEDHLPPVPDAQKPEPEEIYLEIAEISWGAW